MFHKGSAFASLTSVENSDICQKLFFYFDKFLSNVWKLVRSHHRQRNDIHYDVLQFPEITNLTSVQLILTNVRMKYLSRHIFSLKQQLVRQNQLWRFDSDKCQWGRCMAHKRQIIRIHLDDFSLTFVGIKSSLSILTY